MRRSAAATTVVIAVAVLLPGLWSVVVLAAVALLVMTVALGVAALTLTTRVNMAGGPAAKVGLVNVTGPVPPTAGEAIVQPAGAVADRKVVLAGTWSVS